jgi:hypothetical protein
MNEAFVSTMTLASSLPSDWPQRAAWLLVQAIAGGALALTLIGATYWASRRRARRSGSRRDVGAF